MSFDHTLLLIPMGTSLSCAMPLYEYFAGILRSHSNCDVIIPSFGEFSLEAIPHAELISGVRANVAFHLESQGAAPLASSTLALYLAIRGGHLFLEVMRLKESMKLFHRVTDIRPPDWDGLTLGLGHLRRAMLQELQFDEASFMNSRADWDGEQGFFQALGLDLVSAGNLDGARAAWIRVLELRPGAISALLNIGQSYSDQGQFEDAEEWLSEALSHDPDEQNRAMSLWNRGLARVNLRKWSDAKADFEGVLRIDENFGYAYLNLANCCRMLGLAAESERNLAICANIPDYCLSAFGPNNAASSRAQNILSTGSWKS